MVYFWQKQYRHSRLSSPKTAISPLISAATTAADTALAAVVSSKSQKKLRNELKDVRTAGTTTGRPENAGTSQPSNRGNLGDSGVLGGGGEREGNSNTNSRGPLSSPGCRGHSSVMTNKIQSLVLDKLSEYARRKQENNRRRVAERELDSLNLKIDRLLSQMGDGEASGQTKLGPEEECVVCLAVPATMKTFPCGHRVVCRKCLIKTMQVAISQRCLPLRCVICRNRILSLQHAQDSSDKSSAICLSEDSKQKPTSNHGNLATASHGPGRILRSNTTPVVVEHSALSNSSSASPSPDSLQDFVPSHQHEARFSNVQASSTSQNVVSTGLSLPYHSSTPSQAQISQPGYVLLQKKCNSKSVKRLLGTR